MKLNIKDYKGFTLTEALICALIFSIMVGISSYSFRFFISIVKHIIMPYPKEAINFSRLRDSIKSISYFVGQKKNLSGTSNFYYYFYGSAKQLKFITTKPLLSNRLSLCHIYEKNGDLVWEEYPVYDINNNYKELIINSKPLKTVIFKDISDIRFSYFKDHKKVACPLKEDIPDFIEIKFVNKKGKEKRFLFNIESRFRNKKELTNYFYVTF